MLCHDPIYGAVEIGETVLNDLMESAALQRLHGVLQHGITSLIGITQPITRFEHSIGAMLLARRLGAPLEEQIAALLHDVSHTAFSHVIDFVFDDHGRQSYHEEKKADYIAGTDIPDRLAAHGYDWRDFVDEVAFPLLEQPAPALCADRVDYFLRDANYLALASDDAIQRAIDHLAVHRGRIVVDGLSTAQWLAYTYVAADQASWANFREVGLYELTARAIKMGLAIGVIGEGDVWSTDESLWSKLWTSEDAGLRGVLRLVSPDTRFVWDEQTPHFWVGTKLRTIDPDVLVGGRARPLSQIDAKFARYRTEYLHSRRGRWPVRVVTSDVDLGAGLRALLRET